MRNGTATSSIVSGTTGGTCQVSGPYKCDRHTDVVIFFKAGDKFPADPMDGRSTTWTLKQ